MLVVMLNFPIIYVETYTYVAKPREYSYISIYVHQLDFGHINFLSSSVQGYSATIISCIAVMN